ncbi:MAG TPA: T9SS type A sorting domain-containing protein, partial [Bacteroidia bacterium]|nr:T9SS type A sorting domain-containing protein [Bacteroidia bacterium]
GMDVYGCKTKDSTKIIVNPCTGINELYLNNDQTFVFPNPSQDKVTISFTVNEMGAYSINVIDMFGRIVKNETGKSVVGENSHIVLLTDVSKGLYFITIQQGQSRFRTKIVVE